jgi:5'-3' exonuclease
MDCNSVIYDAVHTLEKNIDPLTPFDSNVFEIAVIEKVCEKIDEYIRYINPTTTVFIAFDGVAPFAKMDQQRTRRYKSAFMSKISFGAENKATLWNTAAITPGTAFMQKLSHRIEYLFKHSEQKYNVSNVLVSCSNEVGEGEHKLFQHLRNNRFNNDYVAVYGLDSDLIMLSIFHLKYCKNVYIFREAPEFLKSSIPIDHDGKDTDPHFLDIRHLSSSILSEMNCKFADPQRIVDYVFLCFFLGNDFLPHFPAMNIRTHGIQALLDTYRITLGNQVDRFFVSKTTGKIQWKNVAVFLKDVAKNEHGFLLNEYFVRDKLDRRRFLETTPEEKSDALNNCPIIYRADEKYICPSETDWESRYYKTLFRCDRSADNIKNICNNYLEGLEWVLRYYTENCPNWKWKYNYHYPPLFTDLIKYVPHFEMDFVKLDPSQFSYLAQLTYVLPSSNLHLLPTNIREFLQKHYGELYPEHYEFQWAFCRYFWEAHPLLPDIDVKLLEQWNVQFNMQN